MESFTTHTGTALPLRASNVDTDQILPAEFLKLITRSGFEKGLFANWRKDPDFILNQPEYVSSSILVTGPDFGTGSSREHAVWALQNYGFRVVLAPRFGDIFYSNSGKAGLLLGKISHADLETLWQLLEAKPGADLTVDLQNQTVLAEDGTQVATFEIDEYTKWRLLNGLDDISITLQDESRIAQYEQGRSAMKPSLKSA